MRLLVGDIGGTNARLVIYEIPDDTIVAPDPNVLTSHKIVSQRYYKNNDFQSFNEVLSKFLSLPQNIDGKIHVCCLAVAGPVSNNQIIFTNREGWILDGSSISQEFSISSVALINDFVANGYGLLTLNDEELVTLQKGKRGTSESCIEPIALVGAGTGLGECFLTPSADGKLNAYATEGGHVEFAPRTPLEIELLSFLQKRMDTTSSTSPTFSEMELLPRVSVERLVSGNGLENIYEFLREKYPEQVSKDFDHNYQTSRERGRLIGNQKYNYSLFKQALEIMFAVYGGEVGNVALKYLPYGGIYIAGGIAPKNVEFMTSHDSEFLMRFGDKGRLSSIMSDFSVYVVMKEDLGIRGAHVFACRRAAELMENTKGPTKTTIDKEERSRNKESAFSFSKPLTDFVKSYPMTYAFIVSTTAALTFTACIVGVQVLKKMGHKVGRA